MTEWQSKVSFFPGNTKVLSVWMLFLLCVHISIKTPAKFTCFGCHLIFILSKLILLCKPVGVLHHKFNHFRLSMLCSIEVSHSTTLGSGSFIVACSKSEALLIQIESKKIIQLSLDETIIELFNFGSGF